MPPLPSILSLWSVTKWSKLAHTSPLPAYANVWRQAGVNTFLCLPAIISMLEQSGDSGLVKQQGGVPGGDPNHSYWSDVLYSRDPEQY